MSQEAEPIAGDDLSALAWVQGELRRTLETAHKALRRYVREVEGVGGSDVDSADPAVGLCAVASLRILLERLEAVVPALQAAGLTISPRDIYLARHHPTGPAGRALRAVRINTRPLCGDKTIPQRCLRASRA